MYFFVISNEVHWKEIWLKVARATRLLETSCLEKITACVIETMLMTLPLVQMIKARKEKGTEQTKYKPKQTWKVFKRLLYT